MEERAEFDALCSDAEQSATSTAERVEEFRRRIHDARQAHRFYASDVLDEAEVRGLASIFKGWQKRQRIPFVTPDGREVAKPRVIGVGQTDDEGRRYSTQTLFDLLTREEIEAKIAEYAAQVRAFRDNIAVCLRLLELLDAVPTAATPAEAAELLGTTVEAFLGTGRAA